MRSIVLAIATAIALVTYAQNSALAQGVPIGVRGSVPVCTHAELHAGTCQQETAGYTATITDGLSSDPDRCAAAGTGGGGDQVTCRYKDGDWEEFEPVAGGATNLGTNVGASSVTVTSSSGADAVLPAATGSTAGVQTAADKSKLDGVSAGAIAAVVQDNAPQLGGNLDGQGHDATGVGKLGADVVQEGQYDAVYYLDDPATACATYAAALEPYMESTAAPGQYRLKFVFNLTGANKLVVASHYYDDSGNWPYAACFVAHPQLNGSSYNGSFPDSLGRVTNNVALVSTSSNPIQATLDFDGQIEFDQTGIAKQAALFEFGNHYMAGCPDPDEDSVCDHHYGSLSGRIKVQGDLQIRNVVDVEGGWTGQGTLAMSKTKRFSAQTETTHVVLALNGATYTDMGGLTIRVQGQDHSDIALHSLSSFGLIPPKLDLLQGDNDGYGAYFYGKQAFAAPAKDWRLSSLDHAILFGDAVNGGQQVFYQSCDALDDENIGTCGDANGVGRPEQTNGVLIDGVLLENNVYSYISEPKPGGDNSIVNIQGEGLSASSGSFSGSAIAIGPYYCDGTGTTPLPYGSIVAEAADCAAASGAALAAPGGPTGDYPQLHLGASVWPLGDSGNSILLGPRCITGTRISIDGPGEVEGDSVGEEFAISTSIASSGGCEVVASARPRDGAYTSYYGLRIPLMQTQAGALSGLSSIDLDAPAGTAVATQTWPEGVSHGSEALTINGPAGGFASNRSCTLEDDDTPYDGCVSGGGGAASSVTSSAGAAPTTSAAIAYDSTSHTLEYGANGTNRTIVNTDEAQTLATKTLASPAFSGTASGANTIPTSMLTTEVRTIAWKPGDLEVDGTNCTAPASTTINGTGRTKAIICTNNAASAIYGATLMPDSWDGGQVRALVAGTTSEAADSGLVWGFFDAICAGDGETISGSWGTAGAHSMAVGGQWSQQLSNGPLVTPAGTCAGGDILYWRWRVDDAQTDAVMASWRFTGFKIEFTTNVGD